MTTVEIYRVLCAAVYNQNVMTMSEGTVRQWCTVFKDGRTNDDEQRSGRPSVLSHHLEVLTKKFVKDGSSRFQNFRVNFHKFKRHSLLDYHG
jgi:transposase